MQFLKTLFSFLQDMASPPGMVENPLPDEPCPAPVDDADKENTPPEGRATPTRDERDLSSQGSLPCAVGELYLHKVGLVFTGTKILITD